MAIQQLLMQRAGTVPFLLLDFEPLPSTVEQYWCKATGAQFAPTDPGNPAAMGLSTLEKKFGLASLVSQVNGGAFRFVSLADSLAWDFLSNTKDFILAVWFKIITMPSSGSSRPLVRIHATAYNSNAAITLNVSGGSGSGPRITLSAPLSINFVASVQTAPLVIDGNWHLAVGARIGSKLYVSFDGSPSPAGVNCGIGTSEPQPCNVAVANYGLTASSNQQLNAYVDHVFGSTQIVYDVINGFAVPTAPPAL